MKMRLLLYGFSMIAYSLFMASHAPGGFGWHDYHAYRIFNAVEYLKLNGYFANYGFSIWSDCRDCDLTLSHWDDKIYLSQPALFQLWPYIALNSVVGTTVFFSLGPIIDKLVVFITAMVIAEFFVMFAYRAKENKRSDFISSSLCRPLPTWWLGLMVFCLYVTSVWSYQMQRAMWNEIWFYLFFSFSLLALLRDRFVLGCLLLLIAGLMHYLSAFVLAIVFVALLIFSMIYRERTVFRSFVMPVLHQYRRFYIYCICAALPPLLYFALRAIYVSSTGLDGTGSPLLWRIGISGDDAHNGGIIGAFQFFGGVRVSQCISMLGTEGFQNASLFSKISAFNCFLTISGMVLVSVLSVLGVIWLLRRKPEIRPFLFPVAMILLITLSSLQQSFSVHLLGHNYPFAILFAFGLVGLCLKGAGFIQSRAISIIVFTPVVVACVLLSIRVSMLLPG